MIELVNRICQHIPKGFKISLTMEQGAAWVTLTNDNKMKIHHIDGIDQTLEEQLNEALNIANGFI